MIKHSQITQSNKFAISLQYLKKDVRNGGHFWHADKRQSFYKLVLSFLMELARHVQNTQNRKLVIFLQCFRKNIAAALRSIVMQNIQIFYGGPVMFVVTYFTIKTSSINVISISLQVNTFLFHEITYNYQNLLRFSSRSFMK